MYIFFLNSYFGGGHSFLTERSFIESLAAKVENPDPFSNKEKILSFKNENFLSYPLFLKKPIGNYYKINNLTFFSYSNNLYPSPGVHLISISNTEQFTSAIDFGDFCYFLPRNKITKNLILKDKNNKCYYSISKTKFNLNFHPNDFETDIDYRQKIRLQRILKYAQSISFYSFQDISQYPLFSSDEIENQLKNQKQLSRPIHSGIKLSNHPLSFTPEELQNVTDSLSRCFLLSHLKPEERVGLLNFRSDLNQNYAQVVTSALSQINVVQTVNFTNPTIEQFIHVWKNSRFETLIILSDHANSSLIKELRKIRYDLKRIIWITPKPIEIKESSISIQQILFHDEIGVYGHQCIFMYKNRFHFLWDSVFM